MLNSKTATATDIINDVNDLSVGKEPKFSKNNAFNKNFGNSADTVCQGNDSRLSDARKANGGNADTIGGKSIWIGTQSTYESLSTKDNNTLYFTTEG